MGRPNLGSLLSTVQAGREADADAPRSERSATTTPAETPDSDHMGARESATAPEGASSGRSASVETSPAPEVDQRPATRSRGRKTTQSSARTASPAREVTAQRKQPPPSGAGEGPRYLQLERKETRLRADQYADLTSRSRDLNRARQGAGERITENTLIRVAIDLLLARGHDLSGTTEDELRDSVGL